MTDYPWVCPACKATVAAGRPACERCGCPEDASPAQADEYLRAYSSGQVAQATRNSCPKCRRDDWTAGEFRASGGGVSAVFDVATVRFRALSCRHCGFTELYRADLGTGSKVLDFLMSN